LMFEFLKIVMWFNPMIYSYQKRITLVHEYISDEVVSKKEAKEIYINNLLSNYFQVENISFVNQFYKQSLIKKRIMMMTKKQSKKMNQLKYLVLLPVLTSMLFYTSCSENNSEVLAEGKKAPQTMYINANGKLNQTIGKEETFLDVYIGIGEGYQFPKGKELNVNALSEGEKLEYLEFKESSESGETFKLDVKIFEYKNNRKVVAFSPQSFGNITEKVEYKSEMSFMVIDKAPTFPGCETGDKDCFSKMIQKHFVNNFDSKMVNELGLSKGRKRIFIGFKIDKQGAIVDVQVRAPHEDIKAEVLSVMSSLPKVIPGENEGKVVAVKYSIPFTIIVE
jgi:bla regulator protein BlaR1